MAGREVRHAVCGLVLALGFPAVSAFAAPRLVAPPEGVSFGEIAAGEEASKSVELRNASAHEVAVSQVRGCCGAEAALSPMRVGPGQAATLAVTVRPQLPGEFSKHVRVLCDDPESPVVVVPVTGTAVAAAARGCSAGGRSASAPSSRTWRWALA